MGTGCIRMHKMFTKLISRLLKTRKQQ